MPTQLRSKSVFVFLLFANLLLSPVVLAVPPSAPANLSAVAGDGVVALDWDDVIDPDLDLYNVYRSTTAGGPHAFFDEVDPNESSYTDIFVTNGVTYYYVVTAVNGLGEESALSNEVSATPEIFDNLLSAFRIEAQAGNPAGLNSVVIDAGGNIIVCGGANGFADLNADGDFDDFGESFAHGGSDGYISKFTAAGAGVFAVRVGSTSTIERVREIGVDDLGNIYGIGIIGSTQPMDLNGDLDFDDANENVARNFFVTSFDPNGAFRWGKRFGSDSSTSALVVEFDPSTGNLVLGGRISNDADLNADGDELDGVAEAGPGIANQIIEDPFISVFDRDGVFRWTKRLGSIEQFVAESMTGVAFDSTNRVIAVGVVSNREDADLNGDDDTLDEAETLTSPSTVAGGNGFLSVFDSNGNHIFARRFSTSPGFSTTSANKVVVDAADNIYIFGTGGGTIDLNADGDFADPDEVEALVGSSYITAFDSAGNHLWAVRMTHTDQVDEFGSPFTFRTSDFAFDAAGGLLSLLGTVENSADMNGDGDFTDGSPETGIGVSCDTPAECTTSDLFITTFDTSGAFVGATRIGDQAGFLSTGALTFDSQSDVIVVTDIRADVDINNDGDLFDAGEVQLLGGTGFAGLVLELDQPFNPPDLGPNQAPVVDAGPDQLVTLEQAFGEGFFLSATAFDDGLPDPPGTVAFNWSRISGAGAVNIVPNDELIARAQLDTIGFHTFQFAADDSELIGTDTMIVQVAFDLAPPQPPTNLQAFAGDGGVFLDWDDNPEPDVIGYRIFISTNSTGPFVEVDQDDPSQFPVFGLTNGVTYFFVVTAFDETDMESGFSNVASATPMAGLGCTLSSECDDGLACTGVETCKFSFCVDGTAVDCDDGDFCTVDSCVEPTGACDNTPLFPPTPGNPSPGNGATNVPTNVTLTWDSGASATASSASIDVAVAGRKGLAPSARSGLKTEYIDRDRVDAAIDEAVGQNRINRPQAAPTAQSLSVAPAAATGPQNVGTVTADDIFLFEDTNSVLANFFIDGELFALMFEAVNAMTAVHGDNYDFVGFFLNYVPSRQIGLAFYLSVENDVSGIGDTLFNNRPAFGINGGNVEGLVMMWVVDDWEPGSSTAADFTRLVLGQEFEHRFGVFLSPVQGGTLPLQGDDSACGRSAHWNFKVDGQGSGMEIREWIGNSPAVLGGDCIPEFDQLCFNGDTGGVFSYPDLYLMGYVSAAELDAGASEFRYMVSSDCASDYFGTITNLSSGDIIAADGPRVPDSTNAQQDFRTGWIMFHLPGAPPTTAQLDRAAGILNQHQQDWQDSTLGRGTMNNALVAPCPTTHDVLIGTSNPPLTLACDDIEPSMCDPGALQPATTYFWQVVSTNPSGSTSGPVWSFTTQAPQCDDDGVCESGEDCDNCPNDCFTGSGASCGNDICESADGEDCLSCPSDCNGQQSGNPNNRFCCGDGVTGQGAVDCTDNRCTASGNTCTDVPASVSCCGDGLCEGAEDVANCLVDCAECAIPADCDDFDACTIDDCNGGVCDNAPIDCSDGDACTTDSCSGGVCSNDPISCDDGDACTTDTCDPVSGCANTFPVCGPADGCCGPACDASDPDCACAGSGASCSNNAECCSNNCKGNGICK